ncbi:MAG: thiamine pyrophosphate-binding protein [Chloroflexi bacterium]|nr:thiamine pyrophosphate-binding protein [Chloroflexota bacterium]
MAIETRAREATDRSERTPQYGSDLIVDILARLGIEYAAFNPGASFRGLHDSLVNYGGDRSPRTVLCCHEEISVALAHGYAKATGRPMVAALHDVVGLQHACMAIFNAWCDRVPVLLLGGTGPMDSARRRPWIEWIHTALVQGDHVRDFVKWDDQPASAAAAVESMLRAYRLMTSEPTGPVYVCLDAALQEDPLPRDVTVPRDVERWIKQSPLQADPDGLRTAARWLSESRRPVILADRVGRSQDAVDALRAIAEQLRAPVVDLGSRFNFPSSHPLESTAIAEELLREADLILAVDVVDLWGALQASAGRHRPAGYAPSSETRIISLSLGDLLAHSWAADYQRMQPVDLNLIGDTRVALPALLELLEPRAAAHADRRARAERISAEGAASRGAWSQQARSHAERETISTAYLALALREALGERDFVLSNSDLRGWARRLWNVDSQYQFTGSAGGAGLGYGIGASLGVGLAHVGSGRIVVDIQPDGDLLYCTSALWTVARERLPLLIVMWNNRSYYNSEEHALRMAEQRGRPAERAGIGTQPVQPNVDFATVARGFGIEAGGPVTSPSDLPAALARAVEVLDSGQPFLLDVVTEVR